MDEKASETSIDQEVLFWQLVERWIISRATVVGVDLRVDPDRRQVDANGPHPLNGFAIAYVVDPYADREAIVLQTWAAMRRSRIMVVVIHVAMSSLNQNQQLRHWRTRHSPVGHHGPPVVDRDRCAARCGC
jgi:hypothetical protein